MNESSKLAVNGLVLALGLSLAGLLYYAHTHPFVIPAVIDAKIRFDAIEQLINHGTLSQMKYSMLLSLLATPLYLLGNVVGSPETMVSYFNLLVLLLMLCSFCIVGRQVFPLSVVMAFVVLVVAGSMFPAHIQFFMGETFGAAAVTIGVLAIIKGAFTIGLLLLSLACLNTPALAGGLLTLCCYWLLERRKLRFVLIPAAFVALFVAESWLRRGGLTGYEGDAGVKNVLPYSDAPGFSYPFVFGLLSLLFSFGKGLVFYAPGLLLAFDKRVKTYCGARAEEVINSYLIFLLGMLLVYSRWWAWHGDDFWGPRFFLFASIPASLLLALSFCDPESSTKKRCFTVAAILWSGWVCINGSVFFLESIGQFQSGSNYQLNFVTWYVPELTALFHPFVAPQEYSVDGDEYRYAALFAAAIVVLVLPLTFRAVRDLANETRAWLGQRVFVSGWRV